jgi:isoleucyl-tRNA synthetase
MDLKDTLNLPETDFPMRGNLANREPAHFEQWDKQGLYSQILESRKDQPSFILHDGPPYANGNIHMGHALNKILKDMVVRYQTLQGKRCPYVPGWDCHGLPIEQQILKKIGDRIHDMDPLELRKLCHEYALEWIEIQKSQFKRLGILGDWDNPYTTVNPQYEVGILKVLRALVSKGLVRKGHKAVHWDPVFRTALAEAEIEYHPKKSPSIFVAMKAVAPEKMVHLEDLGPEVYFVIWTTTPWTMPANLGISLHPEFDYAVVKAEDGRHFIVAEGLRETFLQQCELENTKVVRTCKAVDWDRAEAHHPILEDKTSLIMLGDHVTLEQGTGCVHTAPGHGADDFMIGKAYGLPVFCPVDVKGCYSEEFPLMAGKFVFDANPEIVELLREKGLLLGHKIIEHEYPFSWRSKKPIIFRATEQWFMELAEGGVRESALKAIDEQVQWIPQWGQDRIRAMVERRPEWCLSRQRHWGVPIPSIRSIQSGESILDARIIERFVALVAEKGTDAWYSEPLSSFLPEGFVYEPTGESSAEEFEKEFDILDVWFDSGASHTAVLQQRDELSFPADLYLEGSDQHRGWFQSALLTSVGAFETAPYKGVLTHGFILDAKGKAMSKSMGNVISPLDLIKEFGADILRLWVASIDYRNDVGISKEIMKITADAYRTIRNTFRFQVGNLFDFDPQADLLPVESLNPLDRWALHQIAVLVKDVTEAYGNYEFHRVFHLLNRFYTVTLSSRYHDFLKDRLYTFRHDSEDRRSAQTVIYHHLNALTRLWSPILVFTTDEVWPHIKASGPDAGLKSVHLAHWPQVPANWVHSELNNEVETLLNLRDKVNEKLEELRSQKAIGKSIDAAVTLLVNGNTPEKALLEKYREELPELFIVSQVIIGSSAEEDATIQIQAAPAEGVRCPRCWRTVAILTSTRSGEVCPRCAEAIASLATNSN